MLPCVPLQIAKKNLLCYFAIGYQPKYFFFTFLFVDCIHPTIFDTDSEMRCNITVCEKKKRKKNIKKSNNNKA